MTQKGAGILVLKTKGLLILFSGPSGSGKDTVLNELRSRGVNIKQSVSMTTREIRNGEIDGVDYYFTDVPTFEKRIEEGYFLEYVKYGSNYYGTPKKRIEELIDEGCNVVLKIEVEGAANVRAVFPDAFSIFIMPPTLSELENRLKGRGTETAEAYENRLRIARNEIERAMEYDYIVVNDDVSRCADDVCSILTAQHLLSKNMEQIVSDFTK